MTSERTLRTIDDLVSAGLVGADQADRLALVVARYPLAITPTMAAMAAATDSFDPIARQFVPSLAELTATEGETADPIGDKRHEAVPGVIHRYEDRVLFKLTHACPVYCRFCFRREMVGPGGEQMLDAASLSAAIDYIAGEPRIFEVILTGGDPLILAPRRLSEVTRRLGAIAHVRVLRWHTRVPVVDPARITDDLVAALKAPAQAVFVAIHANHPREFSAAAVRSIARLADAGLALVSQTVLLKGINDDPATMAELMRTFLANRVKPYYLHHPDLAPGTAHFRTTIAEGQALMRALRGRLSGMAQPTYVLDIPGGVAKVPVGPAYLDSDTGEVTAPGGSRHAYALRG